MSTMNSGYPQQTVVVYTQSAWSRFWSWMGWLAFFIVTIIVIGQWVTLAEYFDTSEGIEEKYVQGSKTADDKVAIITISGVIIEGEGFVKNQIDKVKADKNVKAVVIRVDSPGGTVTGSDYIYHHLTELRKQKSVPVVVSMGGMAASGGYYVSMAVGDTPDTIFAEPTCSTGSIGVMIPHYDISGLLAKWDIEDDSIATHPRKLMLSMTREMTPEERALVQAHINDMFVRFKTVIKEGRPVFAADPSLLDQLATGEVFTTGQALKHKLVDKEGFVEDAIARALELASLDKEKTKIVKYKRPVTLLDNLGYAEARRHASPLGASGLDLATLLDFSAPRAWYLTTSLPALLSSRRAD